MISLCCLNSKSLFLQAVSPWLPAHPCFNPFSGLTPGEHLQPAAAEPCSPGPAPAAAAEDGEHAGKQCKAIPAALPLSGKKRNHL